MRSSISNRFRRVIMKKTDINGITIEEMLVLNAIGISFEINDGKIVNCIDGKVGIRNGK